MRRASGILSLLALASSIGLPVDAAPEPTLDQLLLRQERRARKLKRRGPTPASKPHLRAAKKARLRKIAKLSRRRNRH